MNEVRLSDAVGANDYYRTLVGTATHLLWDAVGNIRGTVHADWDLGEDYKGRDLLRLTLKDWTGEVRAEFAPDELSHEYELRGRFYRLWGDLLQLRSRREIHDLQEMVAAGGGGS